jgi:hypothetical protein
MRMVLLVKPLNIGKGGKRSFFVDSKINLKKRR